MHLPGIFAAFRWLQLGEHDRVAYSYNVVGCTSPLLRCLVWRNQAPVLVLSERDKLPTSFLFKRQRGPGTWAKSIGQKAYVSSRSEARKRANYFDRRDRNVLSHVISQKMAQKWRDLTLNFDFTLDFPIILQSRTASERDRQRHICA